MNEQPTICDYTGYDYKKQFWDTVDRRYEDLCERQTIDSLIQSHKLTFDTILDAGCGFGRLYSCYRSYGKQFILLDYAANLLDQAKKDFGAPNIKFVQGSMTEMPLTSDITDLVISIRTLHHIQNPYDFFKESFRVLKTDGVFIFEIPNQVHLLNRIRYFLGILKENPFDKKSLRLGRAFYNFHPELIEDHLKNEGFQIIEKRPLSFFRSRLLKKIVSYRLLAKLDFLFQKLFNTTLLTPSILIMAKKNK